MSENEAPVRFELSINGERKAVGGTEYGFLHATVGRKARHPEKDTLPPFADNPRFDREKWFQEKIEVHFGGTDNLTDERLIWLDQDAAVGDEIVIRILG